MEKTKKKHYSYGAKRWFGLSLIIVSGLIFLLSCFPSFLHIGAFFRGVFGVMVYPLCVLTALIGVALLIGLSYNFDKKFTAYLVIAMTSIVCLVHALFSANVLMHDYTKFSDFGAYLGSTYTMSHGITIGGLVASILVYLVRAISGAVGVVGAYAFYAVMGTLFVGLAIDYAVNVRKKKKKLASDIDNNFEKVIDRDSGISTEEYSFKNFEALGDSPTLDTPEQFSIPIVTNENLFEDNSSVEYSFSQEDEQEEKTQNDTRESAKNVLFGANSVENSENKEEDEQPKSAHEILFGSAPEVPNIFDRSSSDRDAWKRQYASHTLSFDENENNEKPNERIEEPSYEKNDDGAIKTSWGEYRPTSSFNNSTPIEEVKPDRLERINRSAEIRRNISEKSEDAETEKPEINRLRERNIQRTSLSNFNKETEPSESTEFSSRLSERNNGDILANASSLGIESRQNQNFSSILDSSRRSPLAEDRRQPQVEERKPIREERVQPRENFTRQVTKYTPPPTSLLNIYKEEHEDYSEEYKMKSEILESTLSAFKIPAKVINVVRGPKVTRYELTMPTGIPVTKILSYERDMSMNLASRSGVRIEAPIPGKNAFGVEVENAKCSIVGLRELVESPEFVNFKSPLAVAVGKNISGEVVVKSLSRMVHMLVAGSTGSGKSIFLHSIIMSLMYKYSPEELRFIMIDPKRVEFPRYNGMPHLMLPEVVNECSKAVNALNWAVKEMERRYELLMNNKCQKLEQFNECAAVKSGQEKKLPYLIIIIDELAELMTVAKKEIEGKIQRITQLGRAAGIHLVVATQRPSVDVITGVIKNNLPTRVALTLSSAIDSMTVINQGGAEKLLGHGDMLLSAQDSNQIVRLQGALVNDDEIDKTLEFIKAHNASVYDEEIQKTIYAEPEQNDDSDEDGGSASPDDRMDELMPQALKLVMKTGKASISSIQRRFSVGYARAARIIDQMETRGFIDPGIGNKPREIRITIEQYNELFGNFDGE